MGTITNSLIPQMPLNEQVELLTSLLMNRVNREQQSYELGGPFDFPSPYQDALNQIDASIGRLKTLRREMQLVAGHAHDWDDTDYCSICGADGRA